MLGSWLNGIKSLLVVVSIFFFLTGVAVAGLGVWTASNPGEALRVMTSRYRPFPEAAFPLLLVMGTILIAVGVTLLLLGLFGCSGAVCGSRIILCTFFVLILLLFLLELVITVIAFVYREKVNMENAAQQLHMRYKGDNATDILSSFWNTAMVVLDCCGVQGPQDFGPGSLFSEQFPGQAVPVACCRKDGLGANAVTSQHQQCIHGLVDLVNRQGCFHQLVHTMHPYILIVGGVFIGLLVLQLLAMSLTISLFRMIV